MKDILRVVTPEIRLVALGILLGSAAAGAEVPAPAPALPAGPPNPIEGFFPLSEVHRGLMGTAWTVFTGEKPEPMEVEILGVMRGARGPGHDMILAQLHGAKPEYTGVVAGMSGSPVYIGNRLLGSLSYRIGQFSKDPIAGITPIAQMLEVRDLPSSRGLASTQPSSNEPPSNEKDQINEARATGEGAAAGMNFEAMETPLVMSGFHPEAIKFWQKEMAGTGLEMVAAGGSGASLPGKDVEKDAFDPKSANAVAARQTVEPGSAISAQLIRGDLEIAATCTVTYVDPKQLLACGHPILQTGPVSLPMTTTEVLATLASPLNAFKIVNTGVTIGAFTQDRDAAIRGTFGAKANMIPVHVMVHGDTGDRKLNFDVLDLPSLTPQAVMVSIYNTLLETNESTADTSYHVRGTIDLDGYPASPVDIWATSAAGLPSQLVAAVLTGESFNKLYSNDSRQGGVRSVDLSIDAVPRNLQVQLDSARIVSGDIVHAGDLVVVEATLRPWQQPARNVRIPIRLPASLNAGNLRLMVSDAGTLDRTLDQPRISARPADIETALAQARNAHSADRIYVSLLTPQTQAGIEGSTLTSLPLSMANALEPLRTGHDVNMNGESAIVAGQASAGGVLSGFQVLTLHVDDGGGLH